MLVVLAGEVACVDVKYTFLSKGLDTRNKFFTGLSKGDWSGGFCRAGG